MNLRSVGVAVVLAALAASAGVVAASAATPAASSSPAPDGGALFKQRCQGCHVVTPGQPPIVAPNLAGIVGRKAAASSYQYSDALKGANLVWTKANLDKFLAGPQQMVPGTRMIVRVSDPAERAAIIKFLATTGH
jgi:cytochrome c